MDYLNKLRKQLKDLRDLRRITEISDDFCYTNGKIKAIDAEISRINKEIQEKTNGKS